MQALMLFADKESWPSLPNVDIWFFVICALIVVAIVAIYYLIPVFNKKKYQEQRESLEKREAAFKANHQQKVEDSPEEADAVAAQTTEEAKNLDTEPNNHAEN